MTLRTLLALLLFALLFTGCNSPAIGGKRIKREYFPKGQLKSEFIMEDASGMNGVLKKYGLDGNLVSVTTIRGGIKHGYEKLYNKQGTVILETPYVNGKKEGKAKAYYDNGRLWYVLPYKNNMLHGHAVMYDRNGKVIKEAYYRYGKQV